jgi:hypothetical protein
LLPDLLAQRAAQAEEMGALARRTWEQWFSMEVSFHRVVEWCLAICDRRQLPERYLRYAVYAHFLRPVFVRRFLRQKLKR